MRLLSLHGLTKTFGGLTAVDDVSFDVEAGSIVGLPEVFRGFASARMLVFGLVMMVMMVFRTQGIVPHRARVFDLRGLLPRRGEGNP